MPTGFVTFFLMWSSLMGKAVKFRGNSYVLLVMISTKKRGCFFRINKLHEGTMSSIIVPSGNGRSGWRDFRRCLMSMLGREITVVKERPGRNVLRGEEFHPTETKGVQKNWRLVVVIYCSSTDITWEVIKEGLCRKLGRKVDLCALHAKRTILWCRDEVERMIMLRFEFYNLHNTRPVKVVNWSQQEH